MFQQHMSGNLTSSTCHHSDTATVSSTTNCEERAYPKPVFSYSCLIALALKNSKNGSLPVSEIYNFMWDGSLKRATWKLNDISEVSEQESEGCIRAKFELNDGPSKPVTTALQFAAEGATLSGTEFELVGPGYRISLLKKRFATGKYFVDPELSVSYV